MPRVGESRRRIVIETVTPEVDGGRFPIKRVVGERVVVEADIFTDGHDVLAGALLYRPAGQPEWTEAALDPLPNDRWRAGFTVSALGLYEYTLKAWIDRFRTWSRDLFKKLQAVQAEEVDFKIGELLIETSLSDADADTRLRVAEWLAELRSENTPQAERAPLALSEEVAGLVAAHATRAEETAYGKTLLVTVDRERARFSAWYEMFPRSSASEPGRHGTLRDCIARLPYIAGMGFDVLYLPPIHPIGHTHRKGKNNSTDAGPLDPGSPWAIGSEEGGHTAIHPDLGTLEDFQELLARARDYGIEIALDVAYQCSPDHPYVREHPEWFRRRPDGTVQFAENPPKKYEDIYPFDFETEAWHALWEELLEVLRYWIGQGVRIFRIDNPHTKPFNFWEQMIGEVKRRHPEVIFLAEAFTRPKVMGALAKAGFTQSYTYFAWRNTKRELTQYFTQLTQTAMREYFRPNLWPNTPDILTEQLQTGGRAAFVTRLVLAATLGASYGIYGPAYELCEERARHWGSEEYLDSEKYEIRHWEIDCEDSLKLIIGRINRIRRENPALHGDWSLRFHEADNEALICASKQDESGDNAIVTVVNLDPHHTQSGWITLGGEELDIDFSRPYQAHDLLSDERYVWEGPRNFVELNPHIMPAAIFRLRRKIRSERDFDYYM